MHVDALEVQIHSDRTEMGAASGQAVAARIRELMAVQGGVTMVFAAAPSQNEFLATLSSQEEVDWARITAFHLDEYVGLSEDAPQGFGNFLRNYLFGIVQPDTVHYMDGNAADPSEECRRYADLLTAHPLDIACIGIGENGHIAFNDPPVADFDDPERVKVVELDERCRLQQVHDGCFASIDLVPTHALTMTVPAITTARWIYCMVPGPTKTEATRDMLRGPIATSCPASILRRHDRAVLYLDHEAAALL